jgi:hypothetical protein
VVSQTYAGLDGEVASSKRMVDDKGETMRFSLIALGLVALGLALVPPTASAQLVFDRGKDIYAAADDGSGVHLLVAAGWLGMDEGLASPAVAPSGDELLFWGETYRNATADHGYTTYGANADGAYALAGGKVTRLSAAPEPARNPDGSQLYSSGDEEPELGPAGVYVYQHTDCSVYFDSGALTWGDACGRSLESAPLSQGAGAVTQFASDCDGTGSNVQDPSGDPASSSLRVAYGGCAYSSDPGNPLVDPQAELVVSGPGQQGQVRVALGADTCCVAHPSAGFSDPSWSPDGQRLVAYNAGGEHDTYNGSGFNTTTVPGGLYVYSDLAHTTAGTLALQAPPDGQGGYLRFSSPRFMGSDKIVFVAQGSVWSIPAACNNCSFPADATKVYDGGSDPATQAAAVDWTTGTIRPGSPPSSPTGGTGTRPTVGPSPVVPVPPLVLPLGGHVDLRTGSVRVTDRKAPISLTCRGVGACSGELSLSVRVRRRVHRRVHGHTRTVTVIKTVVLARAPYYLARGSTESIALRLTRAGQLMLTRARGHKLHVLAMVTIDGERSTTRMIVVWLKGPVSRHRRA